MHNNCYSLWCIHIDFSYWNLYETLSSINVSIFNQSGKLNIKCAYGKYSSEECDCQCIGYQAIPVGDTDKFYIIRSPWTKCTKHGLSSKLYGYKDLNEKLYLGLCVLSMYILILFF